MSLCENSCEFEKYDEETNMVLCKCEIKSNNQIIVSEILNDTNILNNNFTSNYSSSFKMKCYYILFSKEGLRKNIEIYILIFIIMGFISLSILFYKCGYQQLCDGINEIIELKEEEKNIHDNSNMNATIGDKEKDKKNKVNKGNNIVEIEKNEIMKIKQNKRKIVKKKKTKKKNINSIDKIFYENKY
jgi:hypothetical protein